MSETHVCAEMSVPAGKELEAFEAFEAAIRENPGNTTAERTSDVPFLPGPQRLAGINSKVWSNGRTLRVRFLGGTPKLRANVAQFGGEWTRHANITLAFDDAAQAEIRIAFVTGAGS